MISISVIGDWLEKAGMGFMYAMAVCFWICAPLYLSLTWHRQAVWQNSETLWRDSLAKDPNNCIAHFNLAIYLFKHGRIDEAMPHYTEVIILFDRMFQKESNRSNPEIAYHEVLVKAWKHLGFCFYVKGMDGRALLCLEKSKALAKKHQGDVRHSITIQKISPQRGDSNESRVTSPPN